MLYILDSMEEIKMRLLTDDYGKHLMGVEDLLQKHALVEADINVLGERVKVKHLSYTTTHTTTDTTHTHNKERCT